MREGGSREGVCMCVSSVVGVLCTCVVEKERERGEQR
jgi:hypothetical protein